MISSRHTGWWNSIRATYDIEVKNKSNNNNSSGSSSSNMSAQWNRSNNSNQNRKKITKKRDTNREICFELNTMLFLRLTNLSSYDWAEKIIILLLKCKDQQTTIPIHSVTIWHKITNDREKLGSFFCVLLVQYLVVFTTECVLRMKHVLIESTWLGAREQQEQERQNNRRGILHTFQPSELLELCPNHTINYSLTRIAWNEKCTKKCRISNRMWSYLSWEILSMTW